MIQTLLLCTSLLFTTASTTYTSAAYTSVQNGGAFALELTLNGETIDWAVGEAVRRNGDRINPQGEERIFILFDGGRVDLNVADWGTWDHAHVLGASYQRTSPDTYTMSATVRHADAGWEDYASTIEFAGEGVQNGLRELLHPHDNEQPFTRSQSGVVATGEVEVSALDNVQGEGGTSLTLDLESEMFAGLDRAELEINLTRD